MGWWMKRNKKRTLKRGEILLKDLIECCDGKSNPIKFFSADEIRKATNNFSKSNHLSNLFVRDYKWYSGKNANHHKILIKKATNGYEEGFPRDIAISSMVSGQKNLLKLVGCCLEFEDPVMVYHCVKKHYKLDLTEQPWERRMKIAQDIATALAYLHTAFPSPFVYRDLSLDKILLDDDGVAKLRDFSNCVSIPKGETFVEVDMIVGSVGFVDEKYLSSGVVSEETDVFAIGVLMQKLLIGHKKFIKILKYDVEEEAAEGPIIQSQLRLLKFMEERRMYVIVDPEMGEISEEEFCQMKAFQKLSMRCINLKGVVPTMVEVAKELKKIQKYLTNESYSPERISFDSSPEIVSPR